MAITRVGKFKRELIEGALAVGVLIIVDTVVRLFIPITFPSGTALSPEGAERLSHLMNRRLWIEWVAIGLILLCYYFIKMRWGRSRRKG